MWLTLLMLLCTAQADEAGTDWAAIEKRSDRAFRTGWLVGFAGTCAEIGGFAAGDQKLQLAGAVSQKTGVALMLSAGFRERRAVVAQGGEVSTVRGFAGWTLWSIAGGIDIGGPALQDYLIQQGVEVTDVGMELTTMGAAISSHLLAVAQHRHNRLASKRIRRPTAATMRWGVRPVVGQRFTGGQVLGHF